MTRPRGSDLAFVALLAVGLALAVFGILVWQGYFIDDGPSPAAASAGTRTRTSTAPPAQTATRPSTTPTRPAAAKLARVTIVASRGDCWVSAHTGSETGPALAERVLRQGETVNLRGRRIWFELGAAGNVDVTLNGKPRSISSGTTKVVLG